jgi:SAM-dependent methyltransferase
MKRWGSTPVKRVAWNVEFKRGEYSHEVNEGYRSRINNWVEQYCRHGHILDLGCSDGHVGLSLNPKEYASYTGVDVSEIGIQEAREKCRRAGGERYEKNVFLVGDICTYRPEHLMDVILFKDSLYYVNRIKIAGLLDRYGSSLTAGGVFIVHMDNIRRHGWIQLLIERHFEVVEKNSVLDPTGMLLVFR